MAWPMLWAMACYNDHVLTQTVEIVEQVIERKTAGDFAVVQGAAIPQRLDVLFVVDESGSMGNEHDILAARMGDFWAQLTGPDFRDLDWRVGITSTDPDSGLYAWVSHDDPYALARLQTLPGLLEQYPGEAGIDSAITSMAWDTEFHRPDASLLVVWISDEDHQGAYTANGYRGFAGTYKPQPWEVISVAIVYREGDACETVYGSQVGHEYIAAADQVLSICEPDTWTQALDLAKESVPSLSTHWTLGNVPARPYEDHIWVWIDGVPEAGWRYDRGSNQVVLDDMPDAGVWVVVASEAEV